MFRAYVTPYVENRSELSSAGPPGAHSRSSVRSQPLVAGQAGDPDRLLEQSAAGGLGDRLAGSESQEADLAELEMRTLQQPVRVGHPGAVLEAEVDVDRLGRDEGEVPGSAAGRHVVPDQAPAAADPLDGIGHDPSNHRAKGRGMRLDPVGIAGEEGFGRDGIHATTMADAAPAPDMYEGAGRRPGVYGRRKHGRGEVSAAVRGKGRVGGLREQHRVDDVDHAIGDVDIGGDDPSVVDVRGPAADRRVQELLADGSDPGAVQHVATEPFARRHVIEEHGTERADRDVAHARDAQDVEELLERGVGRSEDRELAAAVEGVNEPRAYHGRDEVVELTTRGVYPDGGVDDGRAGFASGNRAGCQSGNQAGRGQQESNTSHDEVSFPFLRLTSQVLVCIGSVETLAAMCNACQALRSVYPVRTMYTIKQAAARSGVTVPLLRAWERRYKVVEPARTASGYRLYDEAALIRLRTMRRLVDEGWSPSNAATAVLEDRVPPAEDTTGVDASGSVPTDDHIERFVAAAGRVDGVGIERALDTMLALGTFETVADRFLMPALVALGEAWASGRIDVAAEHAASHAVHRRLSAAFQAAGDAGADGGVLVGLPPGARHELGALAFAVAARRAGLPTLYLGPDLPVADWVATARRIGAMAAVIGAPTAADGRAAADVAKALRANDPHLTIAVGGMAASNAVADITDWHGTRPVSLPQGLRAAVAALNQTLGRSGR